MTIQSFDPRAAALAVMRDGDTDMAAFFSHFAADCRFQWANAPAVVGPDAIQSMVGDTLAGVASLAHTIHETWADESSAVLRMDVEYGMEDGEQVRTTAVTVMRFADAKLIEYLIFQDPSPLRAAQGR